MKRNIRMEGYSIKKCNNNLIIKIISMLMVFMLISGLFLLPTKVQAATTYTQSVKTGIEAFPEDYKKLLKNFIAETEHTNWTFTAYYTGIKWDDFVKGEKGKNRIHQSYDTAYRDPAGNLASGYYTANSAITSYFMDPRNFINERNIFQFLNVSYNKDLYTQNIIEDLTKSINVFNNGKPITFKMKDATTSELKDVSMTYAEIIMKAAEVSQMSPISIVVKIVQEVGANGSGSTSGVYPGYEGYYNFFNVGASDGGDPVAKGLQYAKDKGWSNPYESIVGGAKFNSTDYIQKGQNTAYFYKFDCVGTKILKEGEKQSVTNGDLYHQYMTNVQDPYSQSGNLFTTYTNYGLLDKPLNFIIPVFDNMPEKVEKPSSLSNSNEALYYANISSALTVRSSASTSSAAVKTIYRHDLVEMLKRSAVIDKNGASWDKVKVWDGKEGYTLTEYLEPLLQIEPNIAFGYANVSTTLNVRNAANSTANVIDSAKSKEEMIILEEALPGWYKIKLSNGTIGYVSKQYITLVEKIKINDTTISILSNITADYVAGRLKVNSYTIKNGGKVVSSKGLGTGYKFIANGNEYDIIKPGDANGDTFIDAVDLLLLKRHLLKIEELKGLYNKSQDLDQNNIIDAVDLLLLKRHLLNIETIKP